MKARLAEQSGFSLPEMVLAIGLFSLLVVVAGNLLVTVRNGQQFAVASQNVQENLHFISEIMSKEMRSATGERDAAPCSSLTDASDVNMKVFNTGMSANNNGMTIGYQSSGNILEFKNRFGECVKYYRMDNASGKYLKIKRFKDLTGDGDYDDPNETVDLPVTPDNIQVNSLNFYVVDDEIGTVHSIQPRVTMSMEIQSTNPKFPQKTLLQTTISSRRYE